MAYTTITSTHKKFSAIFTGTTTLDSSSAIFGGVTAEPSTFGFNRAFVDNGQTVTLTFHGVGAIVLPAGTTNFRGNEIGFGSFSGCTGVSVAVSGGSAVLEFSGVPTTISEDYFK